MFFLGGKKIEVEQGTYLKDVLEGDKGYSLIAKADGKLLDLSSKVQGDMHFEEITEAEMIDVYRHSASHIMAQAVKRLYGDVEFAIGPTVENGFYYDFDLDHKFTPDDFEKIENEMRKIIEEDIPINRIEKTKQETLDFLDEQKAKFKIEMVEEKVGDNEITSFYKQGDFSDWCRGPHIPSTGHIVRNSFKIIRVAGAYWRGDEHRDQLQRLYAVAFFTSNELQVYLERMKEAEERDHRKLGKELDLFSFHKEAPGFPFWHGNGMVIFDNVLQFCKELHFKLGYAEIRTPTLLNEDMWRKSGHWDNYKDKMYSTQIDKKFFAIKPMNCPGGTLVYNSNHYSYKDLPIKMAEMGFVHRHEQSGELHGLTRVRGFTQDDAHVYCTPAQLNDEIINVINLVHDTYSVFGFTDYKVELSTRPDKSIGTDEQWSSAERALKNALDVEKMDYTINEGDGAFYGPKIDYHIKDAVGRSWQCGTIQVDFSMPERFGLTYIDENNTKQTPVMIHRAILGSVERFVSILIEHYKGAMPTWLAPEQVRILPISTDKFGDYALEIKEILRSHMIRATVDAKDESLKHKIRLAHNAKVPYMLIVGQKEVDKKGVSVRRRDEKNIGFITIEEFIEKILQENKDRSLNYYIG